jgi:hypothetical protein
MPDTPVAVPGSTDTRNRSLCTGRGTADGDHCCYVAGETCRYLADNGLDAERRFECSLRRDLGSWDAVHADPGYQEHVQSYWNSLGVREDGTPLIESCGAWQPPEGQCCREDR